MTMAAEEKLFLGIDIGTGSVRVGLFTEAGEKVSYSAHDIKRRNARENFYEQSTDDIWSSLKSCMQKVLHDARQTHPQGQVVSLGVDATCSLVACSDDDEFKPVSVTETDSQTEEDGEVYNIILWLDKRAIAETNFINTHTNIAVQQVRSHFGDKISPENEPPKLLWLKNNKPHMIDQCVFFDLADWLTFKCCGNAAVRSSCTVACKWGWGSNQGDTGEWATEFWNAIGLGELCENSFYKIGSQIVQPGKAVGRLTPQAAAELGLTTDCIVASPMIDAHCGSLWTLGINTPTIETYAPLLEQRLSVIAGTSTCFIQLSKGPLFVKGVWGPFRDAIFPGYYITEGGQSVTGELLKNTIERHPSYEGLKDGVGKTKVFDVLSDITESMVQSGAPDPAQHVHCLDYHVGNRSPVADPTLTGAFTGLTLAKNEFDLAVKFRATLQSLCYGARHIIEAMRASGHDVRVLFVCGGLCKSKLFLQELADSTSLPVALSTEEDSVLLGGAMLAKTAYRDSFESDDFNLCIRRSCSAMARLGEVIQPNINRADYHNRKYTVYRKLQQDCVTYKSIMED